MTRNEAKEMVQSRDCNCIEGKKRDNNYNECIDKIFDWFENQIIADKEEDRFREFEIVEDIKTCNEIVKILGNTYISLRIIPREPYPMLYIIEYWVYE